MQTFKRLAVNPMDAQESIRFGVTLLGIYGVMVGSASLLWARNSSDGQARYKTLFEVPGGLSMWSMVVVLSSCGLILAVVMGWKRTAAALLFLGGVWNIAIGTGFLISFFEDPAVIPLSFTAMFMVGIAHCQKSWLLWSSRNVDRVLLADAAKLARGKD